MKNYLVDYRNLMEKLRQLSLTVDSLIGLYYCHLLNFELSGKNVDLAKMTVIVNCSSSPNWMASTAVRVNAEAEINIMLTLVLFQKHSYSRDMYDEAFSGQRSWLYTLIQCLVLNSCSRNMCWINKWHKGYIGLLRSEQYLPLFWMLAWDLCTLEQFLLFAASTLFLFMKNVHSCTLAQWSWGKWHRQISTAFLGRARRTTNGELLLY